MHPLLERLLALVAALGIIATVSSGEGEKWQARRQLIQTRLDQEVRDLEKLYYHLHAHPELAFNEEQTAARMAQELKRLGFEVTPKVGGHGVVGDLKNGAGPTVMVRTDMDALPIIEKSGLFY